MTGGPLDHNDPRMHQAIEEIEELIREHYPEATFKVTASPEDPAAVHLYATVDLTDTDELVDLVIDRELALQEQGVPIHVIPLRSDTAEERMQARKKRPAAECGLAACRCRATTG